MYIKYCHIFHLSTLPRPHPIVQATKNIESHIKAKVTQRSHRWDTNDAEMGVAFYISDPMDNNHPDLIHLGLPSSPSHMNHLLQAFYYDQLNTNINTNHEGQQQNSSITPTTIPESSMNDINTSELTSFNHSHQHLLSSLIVDDLPWLN